MSGGAQRTDETARILQVILDQPEDQVSLARAALLIAANEYPGLDTAKYIERLDAMAQNAGGPSGAENSPFDTISRINRYLYDKEGFSGNAQDYYDPRNSFLNEVLDRKQVFPSRYLWCTSRLPRD